MTDQTKTGHGKKGCGTYGCGRGGHFTCSNVNTSSLLSNTQNSSISTSNKSKVRQINTSDPNILHLDSKNGCTDSPLNPFGCSYLELINALKDGGFYDRDFMEKVNINGVDKNGMEFVLKGEIVANCVVDKYTMDEDIYVDMKKFNTAFNEFLNRNAYKIWEKQLDNDGDFVRKLNAFQKANFIKSALDKGRNLTLEFPLVYKDKNDFKEIVSLMPFFDTIELHSVVCDNLRAYSVSDYDVDDAVDILYEKLNSPAHKNDLAKYASLNELTYKKIKNRFNISKKDILKNNDTAIAFLEINSIQELESLKHLSDEKSYAIKLNEMVNTNSAKAVLELFKPA